MKKQYMKPRMEVMKIQQAQVILAGSYAQDTNTNLGEDAFDPEIIGGNGESR